MRMDFKDLLIKENFDLEKIMVMKHSPTEPKVRKVLPWLAVDRPEVFNAYQQNQNPDAEKALMKADFFASFIGQGDKAIFVGLYRRGSWHPVSNEQFWAIPEIQVLKQFGGEKGMDHQDRQTAQWFELELLDFCAEWKGRLVVKWPPGRLSWRWANRNDFIIHAIHEESIFVREMPSWSELSLTWAELKVLPNKWKVALGHWRAVYFILDVTDGKGYVGSASGNENLLQRWQSYADTGHGGNVKLKKRNPENFIFTILQPTAPDMEKADVERLESSWKKRLHTREFGLNEN
jgi:hypothetical protein